MIDFEPSVPQYYTVKTTVTDTEAQQAVSALALTPAAAVMVFDPRDYALSKSFADQAYRVKTREEAYSLALQADGPSVFLSGEFTLAAYYEDGHREILFP